MTLTFSGARLVDGRLVDVTVTGARITAVTVASEVPAPGEHVELDGHVLIPGLWGRGIRFAEWAVASRGGHAPDEAVRLPQESVDAWAHEAGEAAAARGVVGVVDLGPGDPADAWERRFGAGFDEVRIVACFGRERLERVIAAGLCTGSALDPTGLLTLGSLTLTAEEARDHGLLRRARSFGIEVVVEAGEAEVASVRHALDATGARGVIVPAEAAGEQALDPWRTVAAAMERGLSVGQALEASARSRIAVGEPADLVVLADDPRGLDPAALREQPVAATMVAGRFTYDAIR
ncbi:MAG: hypothetical protein FWD85_07915 [Microbacteriaceae bacterium]|nr:hypothetical protein [Microbacteriaceae bacterium]MCL2795217.1 hypothetical protein [Microbacteriaceae bacterium]